MEKATNGIPEKPEWLTLEEKLRCEKCKMKSCNYRDRYGYQLSILIDCPRKALILNILINWVSAIPIFFLFRRVFNLVSERFFLALSISLVILFFYDMSFIIIEKSIEKLFELLEKKRRENYQKRVKVIEELERKQRKEEEEQQEKDKLRFRDIEEAMAIYNQLESLKKSNAIKQRLSKPYNQMLTAIKELCDDLKIEHFSNATVRNLFKIYLPEVLETCEDFILQYEKEVLSPKEMALFRKLLRTVKDKSEKVKQIMWEKETTNLYVNMLALDEALSTGNKDKEAKK